MNNSIFRFLTLMLGSQFWKAFSKVSFKASWRTIFSGFIGHKCTGNASINIIHFIPLPSFMPPAEAKHKQNAHCDGRRAQLSNDFTKDVKLVNTKVSSFTSEPTQNSSRRVSSFKDSSALLNIWVVNFTKVNPF